MLPYFYFSARFSRQTVSFRHLGFFLVFLVDPRVHAVFASNHQKVSYTALYCSTGISITADFVRTSTLLVVETAIVFECWNVPLADS